MLYIYTQHRQVLFTTFPLHAQNDISVQNHHHMWRNCYNRHFYRTEWNTVVSTNRRLLIYSEAETRWNVELWILGGEKNSCLTCCVYCSLSEHHCVLFLLWTDERSIPRRLKTLPHRSALAATQTMWINVGRLVPGTGLIMFFSVFLLTINQSIV